MNTLKTMFLGAGVVAMLGASGLSAQTAEAQIPFDFTVRGTTLPAGEYTMKRISPTSGVIAIRCVDSGKSITVLAPNYKSELKRGKDNVVLFHRVGDRYFLAEVKVGLVAGHVPPSTEERELLAEANTQPMAAVIVPVTRAH